MEQIPQNDASIRYFLYRHVRLDKNEPFYIGIGSKRKNCQHITIKSEYQRAYATYRNNKLWKRITNKTDYEVEILFESDDHDFIKQKEIEFIQRYGRIDLGTGTLCNFTDGGEGTLNILVSEETRKKKAITMIGEKNHFYGKTHTEKTRKIISKKAKERPLHENFINGMGWCKGRKLTEQEMQNRYTEKGHGAVKKVICFETKEEYYSLAEACRILNLDYRKEKDRINKKAKTSKFYYEGEYFDKYFNLYEVINTETDKKYKSLQKACDNLRLVYSTEKGKMRRGTSIFKRVHEN